MQRDRPEWPAWAGHSLQNRQVNTMAYGCPGCPSPKQPIAGGAEQRLVAGFLLSVIYTWDTRDTRDKEEYQWVVERLLSQVSRASRTAAERSSVSPSRADRQHLAPAPGKQSLVRSVQACEPDRHQLEPRPSASHPRRAHAARWARSVARRIGWQFSSYGKLVGGAFTAGVGEPLPCIASESPCLDRGAGTVTDRQQRREFVERRHQRPTQVAEQNVVEDAECSVLQLFLPQESRYAFCTSHGGQDDAKRLRDTERGSAGRGGSARPGTRQFARRRPYSSAQLGRLRPDNPPRLMAFSIHASARRATSAGSTNLPEAMSRSVAISSCVACP